MQLEKSKFYTDYPKMVDISLKPGDVLEALTLPSGFGEDEYVHLKLSSGKWRLYNFTGTGVSFIGEYDTLGECALVYADWS